MRPHVLIIGGSDSSGGAGIAQDVRGLTDHSIAAAVAITAVTAQTDDGVQRIYPVPAAIVVEQIKSALASRFIRAIKIGMLGAAETVAAVCDALPDRDEIPRVLDPVQRSSSGHELLDAAGLDLLRLRLLPRVTLVTPNIQEAAALLNLAPAPSEDAMIAYARRIRALGAAHVLVKGGHAEGPQAIDVLVGAHGVSRLAMPRQQATMRGTGCALSSAIAAHLAQGISMIEACVRAKRYVSELIGSSRSSMALASRHEPC